jgi:2-dehydro-3-deoxy-D-gluconate 5-dehydrogenase
MFDLQNKVAVITGGNGGIGFGMAQGLATVGARVVIAARNIAKSAAAVELLKSSGAQALAIEVDVTNENSVARLFEQTQARCGHIDILINNAGINIRKPVQALAFAEWQQVVATNLDSAFLCCRAAYPHLKSAGGGKIINIGSMLSIFGAGFAPAYGASKGGIVQLTKSLASAWAADNIQVNAVLPGWVNTDLTRKARVEVEGLHDRVLERTPARRWGEPADFAGTAIFLASAASNFITGVAIPVDGGYSSQA